MPQPAHQNIQDSSPHPSSVTTSFDELTKGLATGAVSRRKVLRWMGSALVGAAFASVPGVAWAACLEGQTRCEDRCVNLQTNERHCGSCSNRCRSTQTCCKGRCVNLRRNERHCGSCSNRCAEGEECVGGECQGDCPSGTTLCGGACVSNICPQDQYFNTASCQCVCPYTAIARCGGNCVANCPPDQTLNCSTCQCEAGLCPSDILGYTFCGGNCVRNCFISDQFINCSTCQCEGSRCPSGYMEIPYPDFGSFCCPNAAVCGTGGAVACCLDPTYTCVITHDPYERSSCQPA
jgi:Stigma-specific protein, Stig1